MKLTHKQLTEIALLTGLVAILLLAAFMVHRYGGKILMRFGIAPASQTATYGSTQIGNWIYSDSLTPDSATVAPGSAVTLTWSVYAYAGNTYYERCAGWQSGDSYSCYLGPTIHWPSGCSPDPRFKANATGDCGNVAYDDAGNVFGHSYTVYPPEGTTVYYLCSNAMRSYPGWGCMTSTITANPTQTTLSSFTSASPTVPYNTATTLSWTGTAGAHLATVQLMGPNFTNYYPNTVNTSNISTGNLTAGSNQFTLQAYDTYYGYVTLYRTVTIPGAPTCTISVSGGGLVPYGGTATLTYTFANGSVTTASIDHGIGSVALVGTPQKYFPSVSPWTVPSNWNSANNTVECIGGGGGGGRGGGGAGGGYAKATNVSLTANGTVSLAIGTGGTGNLGGTGGTGGTTSLGSACSANGGTGGLDGYNNTGAGGTGGAGTVGSILRTGGNGGAYGAGLPGTGGGGGGAAGASGNGATGGAGTGYGGTAGNGGTGGGGSGGGGGTGGSITVAGGIGGAGTNYDATHGSGGGGGGGGSSYWSAGSNAGNGGPGGAYGGGGGGGGQGYNIDGRGGNGGTGLITITNTPLPTALTGVLTATTTFTMTINNPALGSNTCSVTPAGFFPTQNITADNLPTAETIPGGTSATIRWSAVNVLANSCYVTSPQGGTVIQKANSNATGVSTGPVTTLGGAKTYSLQCRTPDNAASTTATTVVVSATPPLTPVLNLMVNSSLNPITIASGTAATLSWSATNVLPNSCYITSPLYGAVVAKADSNLTGLTTGPLYGNTVYSYALECRLSDNSASTTVTSSAVSQVTVSGNLGAFVAPLTPSAKRVRKGGTTAVNWSAINMASCTLSYIDVTHTSPVTLYSLVAAPSGGFIQTINSNTIDTLSCLDGNGTAWVSSVSIGLVPVYQEF